MPLSHSRRSILAGGLALAATTLTPVRPARAQGRKLDRINIVLASGPLAMALQELIRQEGFLEKFDLAPEANFVTEGNRIIGNRIIGSLIAGDMDICPMASLSNVLTAIEKGGRLKLLNGAVVRGQTTVFTAHPDVRAIADLRGRTIGVGGIGSQIHQSMMALLAKNGVDPDAVKFASVGNANDVVRAVSARIVDAGPAAIDFIPQQERFGIRLVAGGDMWTSLPDLPALGGFAADKGITAKREVLVRCLAAYGALFRFLTGLESRAAWKEARRRALNGSGPEFEEVSDFQLDFMRKTRSLALDLALSPQQVDAVQALNLASAAQEKRVPFAAAADMSLAGEALKLLGGPA